MEIAGFMQAIENYYGSYPENRSVKTFVQKYVEKEHKDLEKLLRYITYNHAYRFGPPGVSDIEDAVKEAIRNNKGADTHKPPVFSADELEISDEDYKKGLDILARNGSLKEMMDKALNKLSTRREE